MRAHDLSAGGDVLERVTRCAKRAIVGYGCHPGAAVRLLNVSENATYLVEDPEQGPSILRVHRLGYHTLPEIESELAWMDALRAEAGVRTPRIVPALDGRRVDTTTDPSSGEQRYCVRFEYLPGREPVQHADRAFRRAWRDHGPDAQARQAMGAAGLVHPVPLGLRGSLR